jgi:hypothetical protein
MEQIWDRFSSTISLEYHRVEREREALITSTMKNLSLLLPLVLLRSCRQSFAHLRGRKVCHYHTRHRHVLLVDAESDDDSNKEWIITTLMNRQNEVEEVSSSTSSLSV